MAIAGEVGGPMSEDSPSGTRLRRRWRVLLAHDAAATTCDGLFGVIEHVLGDVEIVDASSIDDARGWLHQGEIDVALVCLDLPPSLIGGVRLAREIQAHGPPVILVTRSQRWLPHDAGSLRLLPWVTPEATAAEVTQAILTTLDATGRVRSLAELPGTRWDGVDIVEAV
jgi:hypothetical protein